MKRIFMATVLWLCFASSAFAAQSADFSYEGLQLGDTCANMREKLGETRVEIDKTMAGRTVTYYIYQDTRIGIDSLTGVIVDMRIGDKRYTANNGVKLGATPYKILKEYGKTDRVKQEGKIYYIYHDEARPGEKIMLDISDGYLEEIRITNLDA